MPFRLPMARELLLSLDSLNHTFQVEVHLDIIRLEKAGEASLLALVAWHSHEACVSRKEDRTLYQLRTD